MGTIGRVAILAALGLAGGTGCRPTDRAGSAVDVTYAASLTATMERLSTRFSERTGRTVRGDPRGSVAGAHLIREAVWRRDAYVTADPATLPLLGPYDPGWAVVFAGSELVLGYSDRTRFAEALDSVATGGMEWHEVVLRPGFRLGRTDPELDPKGYRAIFVFRLAEEHYGLPGLAERLLAGPARETRVFPEEHLSSRVLTGSLDAAVFYLAESRAHGLREIRLPRLLGQGDPQDSDTLARLVYRSSDGRAFRGAPVVYAATVPSNSPDAAAGIEFIVFLLDEEGRASLKEDGYEPLRRWIGEPNRLPAALARLLEGVSLDDR